MDYIFSQLAVLATRFGAVLLAEGEAVSTAASDSKNIKNQSSPFAEMLMPMLLIFAVFYFIIIRPQSKQRRKQDVLRKNISLHNRVMTIGGIIGEVKEIKKGGENKPDEVVLEIDNKTNSRITVVRDAIRENLSMTPEDLERQDSSDDDKAE